MSLWNHELGELTAAYVALIPTLHNPVLSLANHATAGRDSSPMLHGWNVAILRSYDAGTEQCIVWVVFIDVLEAESDLWPFALDQKISSFVIEKRVSLTLHHTIDDEIQSQARTWSQL
jgi:hypothetical protein